MIELWQILGLIQVIGIILLITSAFWLLKFYHELYKEDKNYPENLKKLDDAPFLLYTLGKILPVDALAVGVVGTRKITSYGRQVTESLTADLVSSGMTIISGLAYGVDFGGRRITI